MIIRIVKEKSGELPSYTYFKKVSESWIKDNVFTTSDAIKYSTKYIDKGEAKKEETKVYTTGGFESL